MGRAAIHESEFTPFGLWIKQYVEAYMTVTNIDYFFLRMKGNVVFTALLEEKTNAGRLSDAQRMTFRFLNDQLSLNNNRNYNFGEKWRKKEVQYWGFYVLQFPKNATMPGPGMTLNGKKITAEELALHLSFEKKFCEGTIYNSLNGLEEQTP